MSNLNNNKPVSWDEVIERCYVKKEITAREAMKILNVSSSAFYRTVKNNPNYNEKTKSSYGGSRHRFEGEIKRLEQRIAELEEIIRNLELKIKELNKEHTKELSLYSNEIEYLLKDNKRLVKEISILKEDNQHTLLKEELDKLKIENYYLENDNRELENILETERKAKEINSYKQETKNDLAKEIKEKSSDKQDRFKIDKIIKRF